MSFSCRKLAKYDSVLNYYTRALKVPPDYEDANQYISEAYFELNQQKKAKAHLDG